MGGGLRQKPVSGFAVYWLQMWRELNWFTLWDQHNNLSASGLQWSGQVGNQPAGKGTETVNQFSGKIRLLFASGQGAHKHPNHRCSSGDLWLGRPSRCESDVCLKSSSFEGSSVLDPWGCWSDLLWTSKYVYLCFSNLPFMLKQFQILFWLLRNSTFIFYWDIGQDGYEANFDSLESYLSKIKWHSTSSRKIDTLIKWALRVPRGLLFGAKTRQLFAANVNVLFSVIVYMAFKRNARSPKDLCEISNIFYIKIEALWCSPSSLCLNVAISKGFNNCNNSRLIWNWSI